MTTLFQKNTWLIGVIILITSCYPAPDVAGQFTNEEFNNMASEMAKGKATDLDISEVLKNRGNVTILDSRERSEYEVSHIAGAQWVGYDDFNVDRLNNLSKDSKIIVYCSVGYRSERICEKLQDLGYTNVFNFRGSIFDWVNKGNQVVDMKGNPTNKIHGFDKKWSKWLKKGEVVY